MHDLLHRLVLAHDADSEGAGEKVDSLAFAGQVRPDRRIGADAPGMRGHDLRRIVIGIEADREQVHPGGEGGI